MMDIDSLEFIQQHGSEEAAIKHLVNEAKTDKLPFPYRHLFSEPSEVYFKRLRENMHRS